MTYFKNLRISPLPNFLSGVKLIQVSDFYFSFYLRYFFKLVQHNKNQELKFSLLCVHVFYL